METFYTHWEKWMELLGKFELDVLEHIYITYSTLRPTTQILSFSRNWRGTMSCTLMLNYIRGIASASLRTLFANFLWIWTQGGSFQFLSVSCTVCKARPVYIQHCQPAAPAPKIKLAGLHPKTKRHTVLNWILTVGPEDKGCIAPALNTLMKGHNINK